MFVTAYSREETTVGIKLNNNCTLYIVDRISETDLDEILGAVFVMETTNNNK